jgi:glutathione synthase/RimK-type ligase-like ATP-grasp enzyme
MKNLLTTSVGLRGLHCLAMARAYLRYRNPRRRGMGRQHGAFHERVWREAANELGATCTNLGSGIFEIARDGKFTRVFENVSAIDDPTTLAVLHDKPITSRLLEAQGLPVPRHTTFTLQQMQPAIDFLQSNGGDCVVKPAAGTGGGRGVTTGIRRISHLARAAANAAIYSDQLMIEEQIEGDNYRLLYLDGELVDAYIRRHPMVVGDGRSSVRKLVKNLNDDRARLGVRLSQVMLTVDFDMKRTLHKQGLTLGSVPPEGKAVVLKTVVNENSGADNATATQLLCDEIVQECRNAVLAMRARFVGVDIVTRNPRVSLNESGGAILELNGTPNLYYHYHKCDGSFPIATLLLKKILPPINGSRINSTLDETKEMRD